MNKLSIFVILIANIACVRAEDISLICVGDGEKEYGRGDSSLPSSDPLYLMTRKKNNDEKFLLNINTKTGIFSTKILNGIDEGSDSAINHPHDKNKIFNISTNSFSNNSTYIAQTEDGWFKHVHTNNLDRLTGILTSKYRRTESKSSIVMISNTSYICEKTSPKF